MTTYFWGVASGDGSDAASGLTHAARWATWGKAMATMGPGDKLLLCTSTDGAGTAELAERMVLTISGSAGGGLVEFEVQGGATITAYNLSTPVDRGVIDAEGRSYFRFSGDPVAGRGSLIFGDIADWSPADPDGYAANRQFDLRSCNHFELRFMTVRGARQYTANRVDSACSTYRFGDVLFERHGTNSTGNPPTVGNQANADWGDMFDNEGVACLIERVEVRECGHNGLQTELGNYHIHDDCLFDASWTALAGAFAAAGIPAFPGMRVRNSKGGVGSGADTRHYLTQRCRFRNAAASADQSNNVCSKIDNPHEIFRMCYAWDCVDRIYQAAGESDLLRDGSIRRLHFYNNTTYNTGAIGNHRKANAALNPFGSIFERVAHKNNVHAQLGQVAGNTREAMEFDISGLPNPSTEGWPDSWKGLRYENNIHESATQSPLRFYFRTYDGQVTNFEIQDGASLFPTHFTPDNVIASPGQLAFVDAGARTKAGFELAPGSLGVGTTKPLTTVVGNFVSATTIRVADALYFAAANWGGGDFMSFFGLSGDSIQFLDAAGTPVGAPVEITSINYSTGDLTLAAARSANNGYGVQLVVGGSALVNQGAGQGATPTGTTYFCSESGSDANDGLTSGTAFQTPAKLASVAAPGDTLQIERGGTWTFAEYGINCRMVSSVAGTAAAPITVRPYGSGADPIIDYQFNDLPDFRGIVDLSSAHYWRLNELDVRGAGPDRSVTDVGGICYRIRQCTDVRLTGCRAAGAWRNGIRFLQCTGGLVDDCIVTDASHKDLDAFARTGAVQIDQSTGITVQGGTVELNYGEGVLLNRASGCIVQDVRGHANKYGGVVIDLGSNNITRRNFLTGTDQTAYHRVPGYSGPGLAIGASASQSAADVATWGLANNQFYLNLVAFCQQGASIGNAHPNAQLTDVRFEQNSLVQCETTWALPYVGARTANGFVRGNLAWPVAAQQTQPGGSGIAYDGNHYKALAADPSIVGPNTVTPAITLTKTTGWNAITDVGDVVAGDFRPTNFVQGQFYGYADYEGTLNLNMPGALLPTVIGGSGVDWRVERGEVDFGASEDTQAVAFVTAAGDVDRVMVRITVVGAGASGPTAGTTVDKNNVDIGVSVENVTAAGFDVVRSSSGENVDYRLRWEAWFLPDLGDNEAIVRYQSPVSLTGTSVDVALTGVVDIADCVAFVTGQRNSEAAGEPEDYVCRAQIVDVGGTPTLRLSRFTSSGVTVCSVAVVEFIGANWTVQQVDHTFSAVDTDETETITTVTDWIEAFVVGTARPTGLGQRLDNCFPTVRRGSTVTTLRFRWTGATNGPLATAFVVHNPLLAVEHLDSITGGGTDIPSGGDPSEATIALTSLPDIAEAGIVFQLEHPIPGDDAPNMFGAYEITNATTASIWFSRRDAASQWVLQAIDFSAVVGGGAGGPPSTGWRVERGRVDFGLIADTFSVSYGVAAPDAAHAVPRLANVHHASAGPAAGHVSDLNNDDLGATLESLAANRFAIRRQAGAQNVHYRYDWEAWFPTDAGIHAAHVRFAGDVTLAAGITQTTVALSGVLNLADCAAFVMGCRNDDINDAASSLLCRALLFDDAGTPTLWVERGTGIGTAVASVVVVEFAGSAWTVEQVSHTMTGAGVDQTETIADVTDWATAFIVASIEANGDAQADLAVIVRPGATTTAVRFWVSAAASVFPTVTAFVIRNASLAVQHLDSVTGGGTDIAPGTDPLATSVAVTAVPNVDTTGVVAFADHGAATINYASGWLNYRLSAPNAVELWQSRADDTIQWAVAVIDFSALSVAADTNVASLPVGDVSLAPLPPLVGVSDLAVLTAGDVSLAPLAPSFEVSEGRVPAGALAGLGIPVVTADLSERREVGATLQGREVRASIPDADTE